MVSYIMSGFDVICSAYGVIYIEPVMTYIHFFSKNWYNVIKRGCDFLNSAYGVLHAVGVISYIHMVWYHQSHGCDYMDTVSVMSDTVVVLSFINHMKCHIYWVYYHKQEVSCDRYNCFDVTIVECVMSYRVGVLSWIESMWRHEYSIVMS